jgi:hypothetical protein
MQPPRHHYGALRETEREVDERAEAPTETPTRFTSDTPTAEFVSEIDLLEARRAAHEAMLQERVDAGRINESEKAYRMARFENDEVVAMKQAEIREARELAAAARAYERAEQARAHELDGPER